jgi:hypothetical protein
MDRVTCAVHAQCARSCMQAEQSRRSTQSRQSRSGDVMGRAEALHAQPSQGNPTTARGCHQDECAP